MFTRELHSLCQLGNIMDHEQNWIEAIGWVELREREVPGLGSAWYVWSWSSIPQWNSLYWVQEKWKNHKKSSIDGLMPIRHGNTEVLTNFVLQHFHVQPLSLWGDDQGRYLDVPWIMWRKAHRVTLHPTPGGWSYDAKFFDKLIWRGCTLR